MAFNPSKFRVAPIKSITLCNSAHPINEYVNSMVLRRIPSKDELYEDLFYVVVNTKKGEMVMTYRRESIGTDTIQLHRKTFEEFKALVQACQPLNSEYELVNTDSKNKYIGNDVMRYLKDEELI